MNKSKNEQMPMGIDAGGAIVEPNLAPFKTPNIAVSGGVALTELETAIVDTREFQRLRGLKQLGTSYLVYPSAEHSRFVHALGSLSEAERMMRSIVENPRVGQEAKQIDQRHRELIRLVALLHDLTHVPFGHTLEDETQVLWPPHDQDEDRINHFLRPDSAIGNLLVRQIGPERHKLLLEILTTEHEDVDKLSNHAYISDIVKNTVCADLLDYLKRDVHCCNLSEGIGDRFLRYLFLANYPAGSPTRRLIVRLWEEDLGRHRPDTLSELVNLLNVRYSLGEKVYFHHAKVITSAMIARAVWSAMHPKDGKPLRKKDLYEIGDEELLTQLEHSKDSVAGKLISSLRERKLYDRVYALTREQAVAVQRLDWLAYVTEQFHKNAQNRTNEEDRLARLCGLREGDALIYCPQPDMALKQAQVLVTWKGAIKELQNIDHAVTKRRIEAIQESHQALWMLQVFVSPDANQATRDDLNRWCRATFDPPPEIGEVDHRLIAALYPTINKVVAAKQGPAGIESQVVDELRTITRGSINRVTLEDIEHSVDARMPER